MNSDIRPQTTICDHSWCDCTGPGMTCTDCERCTWNPGPNCALPDHPRCARCGHCTGRHVSPQP